MALHIGVVGEGVCSARIARDAERVGGAIARAGAVLLCGGLGGVMEAAARGAAQAGGVVVGLLPGFRRADANRWVTIPIVTGMDQARNVVLVRSCDAVVAVGGMYGTLSEIALALKLGIPVVGLRTWRLRQPEGRRVSLLTAASPEDAVAQAVGAASRRTRRAQYTSPLGTRATPRTRPSSPPRPGRAPRGDRASAPRRRGDVAGAGRASPEPPPRWRDCDPGRARS
jgi:hypothetical protein